MWPTNRPRLCRLSRDALDNVLDVRDHERAGRENNGYLGKGSSVKRGYRRGHRGMRSSVAGVAEVRGFLRARGGSRLLLLVTAGLLILPAVGAAGWASASGSADQPVVSDELIVGFRPSLALGQQDLVVRQAGGTPERRFRQIDAMLVHGAPGVAKALASDPRVRYVEPNYVVTAAATPNDPRYGELWGMHNTGQTGGTADADIDAPEAWDVQTGSSSVAVGVTDTGDQPSGPRWAAVVNTGRTVARPIRPSSARSARMASTTTGNTYVTTGAAGTS
jgi:hypothetical protein